MSTSAIFVGKDAMQAQTQKLNVVGDNIANANTVAYKTRQALFSDRLGFYGSGIPANGTTPYLGRGVELVNTVSNWSTGVVQQTTVPTHLAISGDGFLPVSLNGSTYYTRDGNFSLVETATSGEYVLMNPDGAVLQGGALSGTDVTIAGPITFAGAPTAIRIYDNGLVEADGSTVTNGQIGLQRFANNDALIRHGGGLFQSTTLASTATTNPTRPGLSGVGPIVQGSLEQSNVDLVNEFSELIMTQRAYQANSRTITTANEMLQEVLNIKR